MKKEILKAIFTKEAITVHDGEEGWWHNNSFYSRDAVEDMWNKETEEKTLDDGFGSQWSNKCPNCGDFSMQIVRPGKVQCGNCG